MHSAPVLLPRKRKTLLYALWQDLTSRTCTSPKLLPDLSNLPFINHIIQREEYGKLTVHSG